MSTARDELTRLVERESEAVKGDDFKKVVRYSEEYTKAYEAAKRLVAEAEAFTQGSEAKRLAMADAFSQQHRTHQQGFVRGVIIAVLAALEFNGASGAFDDRNRAAVEFAKRALAAADEHNAAWMPFI